MLHRNVLQEVVDHRPCVVTSYTAETTMIGQNSCAKENKCAFYLFFNTLFVKVEQEYRMCMI
jgi:hypothetical protein